MGILIQHFHRIVPDYTCFIKVWHICRHRTSVRIACFGSSVLCGDVRLVANEDIGNRLSYDVQWVESRPQVGMPAISMEVFKAARLITVPMFPSGEVLRVRGGDVCGYSDGQALISMSWPMSCVAGSSHETATNFIEEALRRGYSECENSPDDSGYCRVGEEVLRPLVEGTNIWTSSDGL